MLLASAREHYRKQQRVTALGVRQARRQATRGPLAVAQVVASYQLAAATLTYESTPLELAEQGIEAPPTGRPIPASLLTGSAVTQLLDKVRGAAAFDRLIATLLVDASRTAATVDLARRPAVTGHVRALNPPSCGRCAVLAGRVYPHSTGFLRHPMCFPAGTLVSGPTTLGATRRWYEGELVILRTASGKKLSATANHPVLTDRGWVPANLLVEGDQVVSRTSGDRAVALTVPNEDQMPARIEDLWRAGRMDSLRRVPVSSEDFHGDGVGGSHVDVVLVDGLLWNWVEPPLLEQPGEQGFPFASQASVALSNLGSSDELRMSGLASAPFGVGLLDLGETFFGSHTGGSQEPGLAGVSDRHLCLDQSPADQFTRVPGSTGEGVFALSRQIGGDQRGVVNRRSFDARWDAPPVAFSLENRGAYASRGLDLLDRLASQVHLDRLVGTERIGWSGHVYDLTSSEGWFDADGVIVSNCDCLMLPTTQQVGPNLVIDPDEAFRNGQIRGLSSGDVAALEAGADLGQVVNVRRQAAGLTVGSSVYARGGRLTPQGILRLASDRDEAIRLLRQHRYIT